MNRQKWLVLAVVFGLVGSAAIILSKFKANQRLGKPGLRVVENAQGQPVRIQLPEQVLDYESTLLEPYPDEVAALPKDTTFGRRIYQRADGNQVILSAV